MRERDGEKDSSRAGQPNLPERESAVLDASRVQDSGVRTVVTGVWGFGNGVQQPGFRCLVSSIQVSGGWE